MKNGSAISSAKRCQLHHAGNQDCRHRLTIRGDRHQRLGQRLQQLSFTDRDCRGHLAAQLQFQRFELRPRERIQQRHAEPNPDECRQLQLAYQFSRRIHFQRLRLPSVADHLDTITQGGGWSIRMWFSSGIVVPHNSAPICRPLPLIVSQPRERNVGIRAATR
jgi:hypothetical protein